MSNIEITPELLADTRAKAEAATQDEWPYDASYLMEDSDMAYVFRVMNIYDVSYIAAVNPQVVLAMIEHINNLEKELDEARHSEADESGKVARLEREADWLAEKLRELCPHFCQSEDCTVCWRESARKAIAEQK